jgi:hypothetical protein
MLWLLLAAGLATSAPSSTVLFEATAMTHWTEAVVCWGGQARKKPTLGQRRALVRGILAACDRFYPGDETAPYRFLALAISESNGVPIVVDTPREHTRGPFCGGVDEARETCKLYRIECPRSRWEVMSWLMEKPEWAALVAVGTVYRADVRQRFDPIRGMLAYKMGDRGLSECEMTLSKSGKPLTEARTWRHFVAIYEWLRCIRDHHLVSGPFPWCSCVPREFP